MIIRLAAAAAFGIAAINVLWWRRVRIASGLSGEIAILIPARDEETRLPACLESVLPQSASAILVYDDHSTDGTSSVIEDYARRDPRVRRIAPVALPAGWCGKTFACAQLAAQATTKWLLFIDADVELAPGAAARIAAEAERRSVSLLSCWPGFVMRGFWERTLMPMLNFLVFSIFPEPLASMMNSPSLGLAHGACILARRDVYERLGGHSLVHDQVFEDTRLAQRWRARGERSLCLDGQDLVRLRMYAGFGEIWRGFQKNFYPAFRHQTNFWLFMALHGAIFLVPFMRGDWYTSGFVLAARMMLAARFSQPVWSVALHPLGETVLILLGLNSWWKCQSGRGVQWKGRVLWQQL